MSHKSLVNYNINSKILEKFDKKKGSFKKSNLVELWITKFVKGDKNFIPTEKELRDLLNHQLIKRKSGSGGTAIPSSPVPARTQNVTNAEAR